MISKLFNQVVLSEAPEYDVTDDSTLCDTLDKITAYFNRTGRYLIWSGGSEKTIFGDKKVNWAFRAWHDQTHIALKAQFNPLGEYRVYLEQSRQHPEINGLLKCEIMGQIQHYSDNGSFPDDQVEFTKGYINNMKGY